MKRLLTALVAVAIFAAIPARADVQYGTVVLNGGTGTMQLGNGSVLTGSGGPDTRVAVSDGALVTLRNVAITNITDDASHLWAGISCLGDAVLVLEGTNYVKGGSQMHPGITVAPGRTLTIRGSGTLIVESNGYASGIGCDAKVERAAGCGNIVIAGGTIEATGGVNAAAIGGAFQSDCGDITISGGTVKVIGGQYSAAIGSGNYGGCGNIAISGGTIGGVNRNDTSSIGAGTGGSCGNIAISGGSIYARGSSGAGIGSGEFGVCGSIYLSGGDIYALGYTFGPGIGGGHKGSCRDIVITGGSVDADGGQYGAGIGSGYEATCGDIIIGKEVTMVTADAGPDAPRSVGAGRFGTCGDVLVVGSTVGGIAESHYVYNPSYATISSQADWNAFAERVNSGTDSYSGMTVRLKADIAVSTMVGAGGNPFMGVFDGNGHTLTVDIEDSEQCAAPFRQIDGATIRNLTVAGVVSSGAYHAAGLVGSCGNSGPNTISNCTVAATVNGTGYAGGIVGHGGSGTLSISDCVFSGEVNGFANFAGGLLGWCDALTLTISNCLCKGSFTPAGGGRFHPIAVRFANRDVAADVAGAYYLNTIVPTVLGVNPTIQRSNLIAGAEGTPVSATFSDGEWASPVTAADGNVYYGWTDAPAGRLLAHFKFDDAGNGGRNLLRASVGLDAVVRATQATPVAGIGDISAADDEITGDLPEGDGAVAIPNGQHLAVPVPAPLASAAGRPYSVAMKIRVPDSAGWRSLINMPSSNDSDAMVYLQRTTRNIYLKQFNKDSGAGVAATAGFVLVDQWTTLAFVFGGDSTDIYRDGARVLHTEAGSLAGSYADCAAAGGHILVGADDSYDDDLFYLSEFRIYEGAVPLAGFLPGSGTPSDPFVISSAADWNVFAANVAVGLDSSACYRLAADIDSVAVPAGTDGHPFRGTFDGSGHTLAVAMSGDAAFMAPFSRIDGATIRDLSVAGSVAGGLHAAGLVGACGDDRPNNIQNCHVSVSVSAPGYAGGIVGHGGSGSLAISGCSFSGSISSFANYAGGIVGWCDDVALTIGNCIFNGSFSPSGGRFHPIACKYGQGSAHATSSRAFYPNTLVPTAAGDAVVPGAEGTPVSETFVPGEWAQYIYAADGNVYYMEGEGVELALSAKTGAVSLPSACVLTGRGGLNTHVVIEDGAIVTFRDVTIAGGDDYAKQWAGVTCLGDAVIILEGENTVRGFYKYWPGVHVPAGSTLTIRGSGSLTASSNGQAAGIGAGRNVACGSIVIEGGTIVATGGTYSAGIGAGGSAACGDIAITGGIVTAVGGTFGAGIGAADSSPCGGIVIGGGVVSASGGGYGAGIGGGNYSRCDAITVTGGVVAAWGGGFGSGIGSGREGSCGDIVLDGGFVAAAGGDNGAGVGSGRKGSCGDIDIGPNVFRVVATGSGGAAGIGSGNGASCGSVTVAGGLSDTSYGATRIVERVVGLDSLAGDLIVGDGAVLTGALAGNYRLAIASGATVTISNVVVNGVDSPDCPWAGITCLGDATIVLEGANSVQGFQRDYPGILVPAGSTLTIRGSGSLAASGNGDGAGVGGGRGVDCGAIAVEGGTVAATGGGGAAGIGGGEGASCEGVSFGPGIVHVEATCGADCDSPVGAGLNGSCGEVAVDKFLNDTTSGSTRVLSPKFLDLSSLSEDVAITDNYLVTGMLSGCYKVTIADGATVTLRDVTILGVDDPACPWAGITCLGDATIVMEGENVVRGYKSGFPGIQVPAGGTLSVHGIGSLETSGNGGGVGISGAVALDDRLTDTTVGSTRVIAARVVDLASLVGDVTVPDLHYVTGTLCGNYKVTIADGATVTLRDATILGENNYDLEWAGITCLGDATIVIEGENTVRGFDRDYPGIHVPTGSTLTILGSGSLAASSNGYGAGIGGGDSVDCGCIVIAGGTVTATGGSMCAGIGGGCSGACDGIAISGGTVTATGGSEGAGIGGGCSGPCGGIVVSGGTVTATGGNQGAGIGAGNYCTCGDIVVSGGAVTATGGDQGTGIGTSACESICGDITITGGDVAATGGYSAPGIGCGGVDASMCGGISFGRGVVRVVATCGEWCEDPVGAGLEGTCGAIVVDEGLIDTADGQVRTFVPKPMTDLGLLSADVTVPDGHVVTGTLSGRYKVTIADGATVTLRDAAILGVDDPLCPWAGITCLGDATILLEGENTVRGFQRTFPGIRVSEGGTLRISGTGSLVASSNGSGAAIVGSVVVDPRLNDTSDGPVRTFVPKLVDLGTLTGDVTVADGYYVTGTLAGNYNVSIASGATVTLLDATIDGADSPDCPWAGITCLGNATFVLEGMNSVRGFSGDYPGVSVPAGRTLSVQGTGWLVASRNGSGAAISGNVSVDAGLFDATYGSMRVFAANVVNLASLQEDTTIADGYVVTGTLEEACKVSVAAGATVMLCNATIDGIDDYSCQWAGVTCRGSATIVVEGENSVRGFYDEFPGVFVPAGRTLTIRGGGSLAASSNGEGAGIGGGDQIDCGGIVIAGGTVTATGGDCAAGIGGGSFGRCGDIVISGGTVAATGGSSAPGIGSGYYGTCGDVVIGSGIASVTATCGDTLCTPIGTGYEGQCGTIDVADSLIDTTSGQTRMLKSMLTVDLGSLSGDVTIADCHLIVGTLAGSYKVSIAAGATVALRDATILGVDDPLCPWAGITCLGDATIILKGESFVRGFQSGYPGIAVPDGHTLTLMGDGSLTAASNGDSAGIVGATSLDDEMFTMVEGCAMLIETNPPEFKAWAEINGVYGLWRQKDEYGVAYVFRYAFDVPDGEFDAQPLLAISFDASGYPVVLTPPLVNEDGFDISVVATDSIYGDNPVTIPLDASGETVIPANSSPTRFFRLKATKE